MSAPLEGRTSSDWIAALHGAGDASAIGELEGYLRRVLSRALPGRLLPADLDELVQESLARIVKSIASFRGESRFTTWAAGIALRVGFTELRRRSVRDGRHVPFEDVEDELEGRGGHAPDPLESAERSDVLAALGRAIDAHLTERQRVAILAEMRGIPTVEIAARLGTSQNTLYKLTHDARRKLRRALLAAGLLPETPGTPPAPAPTPGREGTR